mgnify:CR=1 FL=1
MKNNLSIGLGLRSSHYSYILKNLPKVDWFEAISENYLDLDSASGELKKTIPLTNLLKIREHYPIALHGVSLSIGSTNPLNKIYLQKLKALIEAVDPLWVSDHICWTGVNQENLHDLLPLPYTQETIDHVANKILQVQDFLKRPMVFENVSAYLSFKHSEMSEWEFIREIVKKTDCEILLDVNNIFVSSKNQNFDPIEFIKTLPKEYIREMHLAGHSSSGSMLIDTHDGPVCHEVLSLYQETLNIVGKIPTLIEWDDKIPEFLILENEIENVLKIWNQEKANE